jgi:hypothetical protein
MKEISMPFACASHSKFLTSTSPESRRAARRLYQVYRNVAGVLRPDPSLRTMPDELAQSSVCLNLSRSYSFHTHPIPTASLLSCTRAEPFTVNGSYLKK